jgi:hypothetical protein
MKPLVQMTDKGERKKAKALDGLGDLTSEAG